MYLLNVAVVDVVALVYMRMNIDMSLDSHVRDRRFCYDQLYMNRTVCYRMLVEDFVSDRSLRQHNWGHIEQI